MLELVKKIRQGLDGSLRPTQTDPDEPEQKAKLPPAAKLLAGFFALMLALSVLSRAADALTVAKVSAAVPKSGSLAYDVEAQGTIESIKELSVTAQAGLRVLDVFVEAGQRVRAGDPLVSFDGEDIETQLLQAQGELQKLQYQQKQQKLSGVSAAEVVDSAQGSLKNAREDYSIALQDAARAIERARIDLAQANEEYRLALQTAEQTQSQTRQQAIDTAQAKLDSTVFSRAEALRAAQRAVEDAQAALTAAEASGDAAAIGGAQTALERAREDQSAAAAHWDAELATAQNALSAAKSAGGSAAQSTESARRAVETAQRALQDAIENQKAKERTGQRTVDSAQQQLDSAQKSAANSAQQALYQSQSLDIDIRLKQRAVDALEKLLQNSTLTSPEDGIVQAVATRVGQRTSGEEVVHIACENKGVRLRAELSEEQAKHAALGDEVALTLDEESVPIRATITSLSPDHAKKTVAITVNLPQSAIGKALPGATAVLNIQKRSRAYSFCLPASAIREDSAGKFVLVMRENNSVLGKEYIAARINVNVVDSDGTTAALLGGVGAKERVIVSSSKPIGTGDRVRLRE